MITDLNSSTAFARATSLSMRTPKAIRETCPV
jgi:hypothetical protein